MLHITEVTGDELPKDTTHGFRVWDEDQVLMFFHWHEQPVEEQLIYHIPEGIEVPEGVDPTLTHEAKHSTSYADVLAALPDRLDSMGYENERDAIMGDVIGIFGVG